MERILDRMIKTVSVILICCVSLMFVTCVGSCISVAWWMNSDIPDELGGQRYDTVEALHQDVVWINALSDDPDTSIFPRDLIGCVPMGDVLLAVCTYASEENAQTEQDSLYVYAIKKLEGGYVKEGSCTTFSLNALYDGSRRCAYGFFECELDGVVCCVGVAYKEITEEKTLYFDGNQMSQIEMRHPITGETFLLCHTTSTRTYSFLKRLFTPNAKQHTVELS